MQASTAEEGAVVIRRLVELSKGMEPPVGAVVGILGVWGTSAEPLPRTPRTPRTPPVPPLPPKL
jgi:hypothetical protein